MTLPIFPALEGTSIEGSKKPEYKGHVFEAVSGREKRWTLRKYPKTTFTINLDALVQRGDETELTDLMGFIFGLEGTTGEFLFDDERDNNLTAGWSATGDGSTVAFQLCRCLGGFVEPVENLNGTPLIYLDDVLVEAGFSIGATGIVTFDAAPADGSVLTWAGQYYYRCRFLQDGYSFDQLLSDLHECADIDFVGSVRNLLS